MAKQQRRAPSRADRHKPQKTIKAAGAIVWRDAPGGREVLLVHRPRYDDWSFPKGKLDQGEPAPSAAVREVAEEAGWHVRLGVPLRKVEYKVDGVPKSVRYWLADPVSGERFEPDTEVDEIAWVSLADGADRMRPADLNLARRAVPTAHPAAPLVVVRHAKSMRRKEWSGDDRDRPLTNEGLAQATRLATLLAAWAPEQVITSPSRRCRDTVAPLAERAGLRLQTEDCLSEEAYEADPAPARALVDRVVRAGRPVLLCTHRPLLAMVARAIGLELPKQARSNPLPKGGVWVAHPGRRVPVERHTT